MAKKARANDQGPPGNTASKKAGMPNKAPISRPSNNSQLSDVGKVLSRRELAGLSKGGNDPLAIMSQALKQGVGLGAGVVNNFGKPNGLGSYVYQGTPSNLDPLRGLSLGRGTAYYGASQYNTPSRSDRDGYTPGSTTYNPIVLPRGTAPGGGGNNNGNGNGGKNANDPYQELRDQIDAAKQTISDLQSQPVDPYAGITSILSATQQTMAEQAQMQANFLENLMIQQQTNFETQMGFAQQQQATMQAQSLEAQRQAEAVANAYVPSLEPTAASPTFGDARNNNRSSAMNTLSNLSILTGMGVSGGVTAVPAASPLAGLQIA